VEWFTWEFWSREFNVGSVAFTPLTIVFGSTLFFALLVVHSLLKRLLARRVFPRFKLDTGVSHALATLLGYIVLVLGVLLILPVTFPGFQFTTLSVILGAVSFGIGFGLRNIADNFVSGLIILLERPIKVGDRIALGELSGDVTAIRARSTSVRTNDNILIIVPNSEFIAQQVVNWSHNDKLVRFRIPVGVHYNSDVREVKEALEKAGLASPNVRRSPAPSAKFVGFGDSSLDFQLWVWTDTRSHNPSAFRSEMNFLIWDALKEANIEIPYPQRDLYVKEMPRNVARLAPEVDDPPAADRQ
jgi:small-conductance mechanosensitive channel